MCDVVVVIVCLVEDFRPVNSYVCKREESENKKDEPSSLSHLVL